MIGTPQSGRRTWTALRVASLVVGVAGLLTTAACGDDGDLNLVPVSPLLPGNLVTTFKDSTFNFTVLHTFAMPDTVLHLAPLTGNPDLLTRDFDRTILDRTRQDFLARGYTQVTPSASVIPDFVVLVGATAGTVLVGSDPPLGVVMASSACTISAAVCGRSAGCFSRQRMTSVASARGSTGRSF